APAATSAPVAAPSPAPAPAAASAAPAFETYKVKRGDVAGRIANSHGMTLKEFLETNGMTLEQANKLREGSTVKVWAGQEALKPGPAVRTPSHPAASNDPNAYVVQPGDTLLGISAKTGVPVATLMKNNGIDNPNAIRAGRALVLKKDAAAPAAQPTAAPTAQPAKQPADAPAKPVKTTKTPKTPKTDKPAEPAVQPVVAQQQQQPKPQDASVPLDQVPVAGTDKSLEDLLDGLSLSDARSQAEEKKETAAKAVEEAVQTAKNAAGDAAKAAPEGFKYYTVKEGENLYHLTARFKVPLAKLRELNDLPKTATKLDPGTVLLIPDVSAVAP
ncbi:MAG: LysM peptidoglycan-binding domain-containing protein, partial [Kiritimatiellae bacterium]|nr:LysM peptidoglycan-binding domain-containing protein [Kiritimatiellia bacterium]